MDVTICKIVRRMAGMAKVLI